MAATNPSLPPKPQRPSPPPPNTPVGKLVKNLHDALLALPAYFESETVIEGIEATDLFALNSSLGGTIEIQVVQTLNTIRKVWDPDDEWLSYRFERRAQSFPDVRLISRTPGQATTQIGIELKGWYLLSKEGVPSFRYQVTPNACANNDLLVVVPWRLKNVLSGSPIVHEPYIENARFAAEARNYWWEHERKAKSAAGINSPSNAVHYPAPKTDVNDKPISDSGDNFGRIPRLKKSLPELNSYIERMKREPVAGIEAGHWISFFKAFTDEKDSDRVWAGIARTLEQRITASTESSADRAAALLRELSDILRT